MLKYAALAGAAAVILCAVWPLGPLADQLFAFHMAQHLLIVALAAPLLVLGGVEFPMRPVFAWTLFVGLFLFWHIPGTYQWMALHHLTLVELTLILAAAIPYWSVALGSNSLNDGARALYVVTAALMMDLPGVVMLFASRPFCAMPGENAAAFGLTPLEDQQMAGLLMWVPANLAFFAIATMLFARWLQPQEAH